MDDITKIDLYSLLDISEDAGTKEIRTAYRKKALSCHPDKHPDNPTAVKLFLQLSKALEILTDAAAKSAYDRVLQARIAAEIRNKQLDSKRRKLKEELEAREKVAEQRKDDAVFEAKKLNEEIARLRKQGSQMLNEEIELMRQQIAREARQNLASDCDESRLPRLKLHWNVSKNHTDCSNHSYESLMDMFSKYGNVTALLVSKRPGSALIEFGHRDAAEAAMNDANGKGNPCVTLTRLYTVPPVETASCQTFPTSSRQNQQRSGDFESTVLMKLRQAQEKKNATNS